VTWILKIKIDQKITDHRALKSQPQPEKKIKKKTKSFNGNGLEKPA
jgi:hypothetical protein